MTWIIVAFVVGVIVGAVGWNIVGGWLFEQAVGRMFGWW